MNREWQIVMNILLAAALAFLLALAPMDSRAAQAGGNEDFCEVVADAAQVAANAREQGALLGQYRSYIAKLAKHGDADMARLLDKVGLIVYTSEDFAGLTSEQAMRYAYRSCMRSGD